ncbi:hypothetical protein [Paenibacillus paeoniae]|uniref:Uncharacterized protein n=1 Tax=Paenibacillus paeoniae TaxID=2292705 RepID=A0A371P1Y6_9BACL|nr:hypothetical protein [Paenibacillus paeoniae]REK69316.1 hypothetical protein DX130_24450 [Paenibacillus paeoniae]
MPVQININGADAAEALKELSSLAAGFGSTAPVLVAQEAKQEDAPKRQRSKPEPKPPKEEPASEPEKDDEQERQEDDLGFEEEEVPTDVQLRAASLEKAKSIGREKVKALLDKYGVPKVSDIPNNKRFAFLKELEALT